MEHAFDMAGRLDLVVTRGWISGWELANLERGSVVTGNSLNAGQDGELTLDGRFLARGSVVVLGDGGGGPDCIAVRIESFERESFVDPEPDRGVSLAELLPFEIVLEGCRYSLRELEGVGIGTIVSMDAAYPAGTGESDLPALALVAAGRVAARGKAVVSGESFGLLLDTCADPVPWSGDPRFSGAVLRRGKTPGMRLKLYDWRRPDCFTKNQIAAIEAIHRGALDALGGLSPDAPALSVTIVDQMNYREYLDSLGTEPLILHSELGGRGWAYEREDRVAPAVRSLVQPREPAVPLSAEVEGRVEDYRATREERAERRPLLAFATGDARLSAGDGELLVRALRSGWRLVGDMQFSEPVSLAEPPILRIEGGAVSGSAGAIAEHGMILLVGCECIGGRLDLVYAAESLYPVWKALERHGRQP